MPLICEGDTIKLVKVIQVWGAWRSEKKRCAEDNDGHYDQTAAHVLFCFVLCTCYMTLLGI
jgi:hypothetical protein